MGVPNVAGVGRSWRISTNNSPYLGTHTHTNVSRPFSRTTWVGWYQKDKPFWILLKQEMTRWQWHQLNHMQIICTSLQTDNHASTSSLHIFYRLNALPATQPTASKHWRSHRISETVQYRRIVSVKDEQEIICTPSKGDIAYDLGWPLATPNHTIFHILQRFSYG